MLWRTENKSAKTAIGTALAKAGFSRAQMRAYGAADEFIADGGTREQWIAVFDARQGMRGEGQPQDGREARLMIADAAQRNGDAGGQSIDADSGQPHFAPASPTPLQLAATRDAKNSSAKAVESIFDRELTFTGKMWGNVDYLGLRNMREDGDIADALMKHIGHLRGQDRFKTVRELMTPREFMAVLRKVRGGKDAAK